MPHSLGAQAVHHHVGERAGTIDLGAGVIEIRWQLVDHDQREVSPMISSILLVN